MCKRGTIQRADAEKNLDQNSGNCSMSSGLASRMVIPGGRLIFRIGECKSISFEGWDLAQDSIVPNHVGEEGLFFQNEPIYKVDY
jgi:hypothetical protein